MTLETLGMTASQITILQKKGITSVEAFLRKQPLHYYDFTETLPLLEHDKRVTDKLATNKAFAIIGTCTSYNVELKNHMQNRGAVREHAVCKLYAGRGLKAYAA